MTLHFSLPGSDGMQSGGQYYFKEYLIFQGCLNTQTALHSLTSTAMRTVSLLFV